MQSHLNSDEPVVDETNRTIDDIRSEVSEHVRLSQQKQKAAFDKCRKQVNFQIGDLVRIEREVPASGQSRELVPKLRGPYRIVQVLDNDRHIVEDTPISRKGNRVFRGTFSVDKIHSWRVFDRSNDTDSSSDSDDS